ncbi:branched-chain amino acid transport system ATP-binding protein [Mycoplana sp. BE70]|uniref:ABC transporter ATP-binding protein n=1 Tax=Mycoplana sp. BE70 TaxID=2817775 RepID=UPI00285F1EA7|nr:ABC transporter ATP-binding protein [Mycoplana sp. BE70]MDR6757509.1 branched-chain amino acid transport system ATP-binding protein [Mycoplana sp. BE70]
MTTPIMSVTDIGKHFGGLVALKGITADFREGQITAIIGPNGAGKSTFFNILSGALKPSTGTLKFRGTDMAGVAQHDYVHRGIARSYQITNIFPNLSVLENVRVAAQAFRSRFNIWTDRGTLHDVEERAQRTLVSVGLSAKSDTLAKFLAHGQQRALEIAISLVAEPALLLLDEPTAGMGPEETREMVTLIEKLAAERTILLVEHKMKMILGLSDRVLVLHHGQLLADGTPKEIQANAEVRRVYLGQNDGYA